MNTVNEIRDQKMREEMHELIVLLRSHEDLLVKYHETRYRNPDIDLDNLDTSARLNVFNNDKIVAVIDMSTGSGYTRMFSGWRVALPSYTPRGTWKVRMHARKPENPQYWGVANIKSSSTVVKKVMAAIKDMPTANDIAAGELVDYLSTVRSEVSKANTRVSNSLSQWALEDIHKTLKAMMGQGLRLNTRTKEDLDRLGQALQDQQHWNSRLEQTTQKMSELRNSEES